MNTDTTMQPAAINASSTISVRCLLLSVALFAVMATVSSSLPSESNLVPNRNLRGQQGGINLVEQASMLLHQENGELQQEEHGRVLQSDDTYLVQWGYNPVFNAGIPRGPYDATVTDSIVHDIVSGCEIDGICRCELSNYPATLYMVGAGKTTMDFKCSFDTMWGDGSGCTTTLHVMIDGTDNQFTHDTTCLTNFQYQLPKTGTDFHQDNPWDDLFEIMPGQRSLVMDNADDVSDSGTISPGSNTEDATYIWDYTGNFEVDPSISLSNARIHNVLEGCINPSTNEFDSTWCNCDVHHEYYGGNVEMHGLGTNGVNFQCSFDVTFGDGTSCTTTMHIWIKSQFARFGDINSWTQTSDCVTGFDYQVPLTGVVLGSSTDALVQK